jgi:hypothetical protein
MTLRNVSFKWDLASGLAPCVNWAFNWFIILVALFYRINTKNGQNFTKISKNSQNFTFTKNGKNFTFTKIVN